MTTPAMPRIEELKADRALWGLTPAEILELDQIQRSPEFSANQDTDQDSWDTAAAAATMALLHPLPSLPSPELMQRLRADAPVELPPIPSLANYRSTGESNGSARNSWIAPFLTAAVVMLTALLWFNRPADPVPVETQRQSLLQSKQAATWVWTKGPSPRAGNPTGDVVWSRDTHSGFMRFQGLPTNENGSVQYQLWIVDSKRPKELIDGGLFDIPKGLGSVIVPFRPKLPILGKAEAFVITLEERGGVVVSAKDHIVAASKPR